MMRVCADFDDLGWVHVMANNNEFDILLIRCKKCGSIIADDNTRRLHMKWHLTLQENGKNE